ncbi:SDR family NAD(P)-dependent oxidoreductase [Leptospira kemamanensis]|uniref:SDR family NAD(P)-dependent oxidoreductase n=1 Tax=Leptospira kemamanensis TaxID=2484942 RepID=A0A4R9JNI7_9LEPT|nr:SDR family NAD(P)-dependent oxidoreductase [Leptospira kemamanensis]TGL47304.1 SDR family NAD(P)-dependent oxidoreductase [Leptospira kemamanensis]
MEQSLVVGGTSDIGVWVIEALAKRGHSLAITGRNKNKLSEIETKIKSTYNVPITSYVLDITDMGSFPKFYSSLKEKPNHVYVLVGYYEDQTQAREDWKELEKTIQINFTGVAALVNHISLAMEKEKKGTITVVSSVAGDRGRKLNYIYGSAKAGLTVYLSGLRALLYPKGVHIGTILLGPVYTKMSFGHNLMPWLTLRPEVAGESIVKAGLNKKDQVYIRWPWYWIMFVIRMIPEWIFKRLPAF